MYYYNVLKWKNVEKSNNRQAGLIFYHHNLTNFTRCFRNITKSDKNSLLDKSKNEEHNVGIPRNSALIYEKRKDECNVSETN